MRSLVIALVVFLFMLLFNRSAESAGFFRNGDLVGVMYGQGMLTISSDWGIVQILDTGWCKNNKEAQDSLTNARLDGDGVVYESLGAYWNTASNSCILTVRLSPEVDYYPGQIVKAYGHTHFTFNHYRPDYDGDLDAARYVVGYTIAPFDYDNTSVNVVGSICALPPRDNYLEFDNLSMGFIVARVKPLPQHKGACTIHFDSYHRFSVDLKNHTAVIAVSPMQR